jgi:hypothetical protein
VPTLQDVRFAKSISTTIHQILVRDLNLSDSFNEYAKKFCRRNNLIHIPVKGDGSCQYASVLIGLKYLQHNLSSYTVPELRRHLAIFIENNQNDPEISAATDAKLLDMNCEKEKDPTIIYDINDLLQRIQSVSGHSTTWGDEYTLYVLSRLLQIQIIVSQLNDPTATVRLSLYHIPLQQYIPPHTPRVFILLHGESHYEAVVPAEDFQTPCIVENPTAFQEVYEELYRPGVIRDSSTSQQQTNSVGIMRSATICDGVTAENIEQYRQYCSSLKLKPAFMHVSKSTNIEKDTVNETLCNKFLSVNDFTIDTRATTGRGVLAARSAVWLGLISQGLKVTNEEMFSSEFIADHMNAFSFLYINEFEKIYGSDHRFSDGFEQYVAEIRSDKICDDLMLRAMSNAWDTAITLIEIDSSVVRVFGKTKIPRIAAKYFYFSNGVSNYQIFVLKFVDTTFNRYYFVKPNFKSSTAALPRKRKARDSSVANGGTNETASTSSTSKTLVQDNVNVSVGARAAEDIDEPFDEFGEESLPLPPLAVENMDCDTSITFDCPNPSVSPAFHRGRCRTRSRGRPRGRSRQSSRGSSSTASTRGTRGSLSRSHSRTSSRTSRGSSRSSSRASSRGSSSDQEGNRIRQSRHRKSLESERLSQEFNTGTDWPPEINEEHVMNCINGFLCATGDEKLSHRTCCVCAYRFFEDTPPTRMVSYSDFQKQFCPVLKKTTDPQTIRDGTIFLSNEDVEEFYCDVMDFNADDYYLEQAGIIHCDETTSQAETIEFRVCSSCHSAITSKNNKSLPKFAIANGNFFGQVPEKLQGLTIIEEMLISKVRAVAILMSLRDSGGNIGNTFLRGHCISFPQNQLKVNRLLPPLLSDMADSIQIAFVGTSIPPTSDLVKRLLRVRKTKVQEAIQYLINHSNSALDQNILSQCNLDALPDDGIPLGLDSVIKFAPDEAAANKDDDTHKGYYQYDHVIDDNPGVPSAQEEIFHIQEFGQLDINGVGITPSQRILHAVVNVPTEQSVVENLEEPSVINTSLGNLQSRILAVAREKNPLNEWNNKLLWYDAFPTLFPNRIGAPEGEMRPVKKVSLTAWIRHMLNIEDDRFRKHKKFLFFIADMLKRRQVCLQSRLKLKSKGFGEVVETLQNLSLEQLTSAVEKTAQGQPLNNPSLRHLTDNLKAVGSNVQGSSFAKKSCRKELMSLQLRYGLPKFFVTINPHDYDSHLIFFFNGVKKTISEPFGDALHYMKRRELVMRDPVAAAKFFDLTIRKFMEIVMGYGDPNGGILGKILAYYGTVEAQGRGTLHFHSLIWLSGFLNAVEFLRRLQSEEFRDRFTKYIDSTISASRRNDVPSVDLSLRIKPNDPDFSPELYRNYVEGFAKKGNTHKCTFTCKKKGTECRFGFGSKGKPLVEKTTVGVDGKLEIKRNQTHLNQYNEAAIYCIRSNLDFTFISGSKDARALAMYIADYISKDEMTTHNIWTILSGIWVKMKDPALEVTRDVAARFILKCLNKLNVLHECSGPQVAQYLLGFPDHYTSESFANVYVGQILDGMTAFKENKPSPIHEFAIAEVDGRLTIRNQLLDYTTRHPGLEGICLYEFVAEYAVRTITKQPRGQSWKFLESHPSAKSLHIVKLGKKVVPSLLKIPPQPNEERDDFERMIIALFTPFRNIQDMLFAQASWKEAYAYVMNNGLISAKMMDIFDNLQDIHGAMEQREIDTNIAELNRETAQEGERVVVDERFVPNIEVPLPDPELMTEMDELIEQLMMGQQQQANQNKVTEESTNAWKVLETLLQQHPIRSDTSSDGVAGNYQKVESLLGRIPTKSDVQFWEAEVKRQALLKATENQILPEEENDQNEEDVVVDNQQADYLSPPAVLVPLANDQYLTIINDIIAENNLNKKQAMAFRIVANHAVEDIMHPLIGKPDPLRMLLTGEGGTGKSRVIKAIQEFFKRIGAPWWLLVSAPTGKAASLILGATIHKLVQFMRQKQRRTGVQEVSEALIVTWGGKKYLIIDECSMVGAAFLAEISSAISKGKSCTSGLSFGGISVILVGDFHQLDPVGQKSLLTSPDDLSISHHSEAGINTRAGLAIFHLEFHTVINLDEQMRQAEDTKYHSLLQNLRQGKGTDEDYLFLMSRVIGKCKDEVQDVFKTKIITTTNDVQRHLNSQLVTAFAKSRNQPEFFFIASDKFKETAQPNAQSRQYILDLPMKKADNLPGSVQLTIGIPVMVTMNVSVPLCITNGSTGILREIIFDPKENLDFSNDTYSVQKLKFQPLALIVEFPNSSFYLNTFPPNCHPIFPVSVNFTHVFSKGPPKKSTSVKRTQVPLVPNFASTNFKCQGDTFTSAIIDMAPSGTTVSKAASAYVSFSRVTRSNQLFILREFPIAIIQRGAKSTVANKEKTLAMKRLEILSISTMEKYKHYFI